MTSIFDREIRTETDLEVHVGVQDTASLALSAPLLEARLINLSCNGGCLSLPKIIINTTHIFFDTLNSSTHHLLIRVVLLGGDEYEVSARPTWMNSFHEGGQATFRIGLEFPEKQKQLHKIVQQMT